MVSARGAPRSFRPSLEKRLQRKATLTWSGQSSAALQLIVTASVDIQIVSKILTSQTIQPPSHPPPSTD